MTYTATAALPYVDAARAVSGLREQLRMLAHGDGAVPDWAAVHASGPEEVVGRHAVVWYEWTAAVDAREVDGHTV